MRAHLSFAVMLLALATISPAGADAQGGPPSGASRGARADDPRRDALEKRFQQRLDSIVRQRLGLTDEQHARLREVASRTEAARRSLRREEFMTRTAMRRELLAGDRANEARVAELLDVMPGLERRRLDLLEQEQKELARFLSPLQRARYFALQDELRRGMQDLQRRRLAPSDSARPAPDGRGTKTRPPA